MAFFKQFPNIIYDLDKKGNKVEVKDIFRFVDVNEKLIDPASAYQYYYIKDGERPDHVSAKLYKNSDFYWTFFVVNDFLKQGYSAWPLSYQQIEKQLKTDYQPYSVLEMDPHDNTKIASNNTSPRTLYVGFKHSSPAGKSWSPAIADGKVFKYDEQRSQLWIEGQSDGLKNHVAKTGHGRLQMRLFTTEGEKDSQLVDFRKGFQYAWQAPVEYQTINDSPQTFYDAINPHPVNWEASRDEFAYGMPWHFNGVSDYVNLKGTTGTPSAWNFGSDDFSIELTFQVNNRDIDDNTYAGNDEILMSTWALSSYTDWPNNTPYERNWIIIKDDDNPAIKVQWSADGITHNNSQIFKYDSPVTSKMINFKMTKSGTNVSATFDGSPANQGTYNNGAPATLPVMQHTPVYFGGDGFSGQHSSAEPDRAASERTIYRFAGDISKAKVINETSGTTILDLDSTIPVRPSNPLIYRQFISDENEQRTKIRVIKPQHIVEFAELYKRLVRL